MQKYIFLYLVLIVSFTCSENNVCAQDTSNTDRTAKSIKLNIYFTKSFTDKNLSIGNISPVFLIKNKWQNVHEIELVNFDISKNTYKLAYLSGYVVGRDTIAETNIGLRYQFDYFFLKNKSNKFSIYNGGSISFHYHRKHIKPFVNTGYPIKVIELTSSFSYVPGIIVYFSDKLYLDINFPINFVTSSYVFQRVYNPYFTEQQQKTGGTAYDLSLPNTFRFRLGVGINL